MIKLLAGAVLAASLSLLTLATLASATTAHTYTAIGYNAPGGFTDGPQWVRLWDTGVKWDDLEPKRGVWHWTDLDNQVAQAEAHHQKVILTLGIPPLWAVPAGSPKFYDGHGSTSPATSINDWNSYVSHVALRYGSRIAAYEPWNEPVAPLFYTGTSKQLFQMARGAYNHIHARVKHVTVLSPAWCCSKGPSLFQTFLHLGGGQYMDALSIHDYPHHASEIGPFIESFRKVMTNAGVIKPVWTTEVGCNTQWSVGCDYSNPKSTGAFARDLFHYIHLHNVRVACWYPYDGGNSPWMGYTQIAPYLPYHRSVTW